MPSSPRPRTSPTSKRPNSSSRVRVFASLTSAEQNSVLRKASLDATVRNSGRLPAFRWADARCLRPELLDVIAVYVRPLFSLGRHPGAIEPVLKGVQADMPAGAVARRLADLVDRVDQRQHGARLMRLDLKPDDVGAP